MSSTKQQAPWVRLQIHRPARIVLMTMDGIGDSWLMHQIASSASPPTKAQHRDVTDVWTYKLELPQISITSIDAENTGMYIKAKSHWQNLVRGNSDGIMFLTNGLEVDPERGFNSEIFMLKELVSDLKETERSVLLVLVDHADQEGARSVGLIEQRIREVLIEHNRGSQCFTVLPVNAETGEGLWTALDWS
ncbi:ADP-ribosylation factor 1 [Elsinoe australis]|uniref:ADP-ribosylation factor 1 n=1 Tax=Elsinoe australis TaxID=40998 RepID=A0A2P7YC16_9PEZI|nr:ADP-ribosylation factor 1 [Elsinoe australis]